MVRGSSKLWKREQVLEAAASSGFLDVMLCMLSCILLCMWKAVGGWIVFAGCAVSADGAVSDAMGVILYVRGCGW